MAEVKEKGTSVPTVMQTRPVQSKGALTVYRGVSEATSIVTAVARHCRMAVQACVAATKGQGRRVGIAALPIILGTLLHFTASSVIDFYQTSPAFLGAHRALLSKKQAPAAAAAYQGPGDVFSNGYAWFSCARAYNAAYANGTNSMCDLVDATTGAVAICTLRASTTGFVDLTGGYCLGSTSPSVACAAAAGGFCRVSKAYDQTGNTRDATQATAANMPSLVFSASPGSATLPIMRCAAGVSCLLQTANVTQAQPITLTGVFQRTANFTTEGIIVGTSGGLIGIGITNSANTAQVKAGTAQTSTANDSTWHSLIGLLNNTACAINVDGSDTAGTNCGASGFSAVGVRINRGGGGQMAGDIAEVGMWAATSTSTNRNNLSANAHSSLSGYNF